MRQNHGADWNEPFGADRLSEEELRQYDRRVRLDDHVPEPLWVSIAVMLGVLTFVLGAGAVFDGVLR